MSDRTAQSRVLYGPRILAAFRDGELASTVTNEQVRQHVGGCDLRTVGRNLASLERRGLLAITHDASNQGFHRAPDGTFTRDLSGRRIVAVETTTWPGVVARPVGVGEVAELTAGEAVQAVAVRTSPPTGTR